MFDSVQERGGRWPCHCDIHPGNLLMLKKDLTKSRLIDFEFLSFGPRAWDLSSLLSEMVIGRIKRVEIEYKFLENMPTEELVRDCCQAYLRTKNEEKVTEFFREVVQVMVGTNWYWILWFLAHTESAEKAKLWSMAARIESKLHCISLIKDRFF